MKQGCLGAHLLASHKRFRQQESAQNLEGILPSLRYLTSTHFYDHVTTRRQPAYVGGGVRLVEGWSLGAGGERCLGLADLRRLRERAEPFQFLS